jgi:hypothetical protein
VFVKEMIKTNLEPIEESDLEAKLKKGEVGSSKREEVPLTAVERETPQEISAAEKDASYGKILSKVQSQNDDDNDQGVIATDAQVGISKMDAQSQVQHLVDIAGQKGVIHAVKVARHMEDNYILDTFHDRILADDLHDALVKRGMIKEL